MAHTAATVKVNGPDVKYTDEDIIADYVYRTTQAKEVGAEMVVEPVEIKYKFRTERKVPRLGVMLVGLGGNNGTTVVAGVLANKHKIAWNTKEGVKQPNYYGSMLLSSTMRLGANAKGEEVYVPLNGVLPMVHPNDIVFSGWDINGADLATAMNRAQVLDFDLQSKLAPLMKDIVPLPSVYYPDFIAANQQERANNLIPGDSKKEHVEHIRKDIRDFKAKNNLDKVIVLWTANTERFSQIIPGMNDTAANLMASLERNEAEISQSTVFAIASILEGVPYINGSPQNTFVPGCCEMAVKNNVYIGGDDFKTGQTKIKSVLVDFLISAGIKPVSIVSYNHLGNNDGKNLSAPQQFRSKEITKSNVVDDMVASNPILYKPDEHPDHVIVIKYVPYVGDSKRAMDEYTSEIFMGGHNTISIHNTCEDSLLATPIILDLVILTELMERITYATGANGKFKRFHPILSILSYLLKAPMVPENATCVNALNRQRAAIENILRACVSLPPDNNMLLEQRTFL